MKKYVEDLKQGDLVDLEGDPIADTGEDPMFGFEYQAVDEVEDSPDGDVVVHFENLTVVFPTGHQVEVDEGVVRL